MDEVEESVEKYQKRYVQKVKLANKVGFDIKGGVKDFTQYEKLEKNAETRRQLEQKQNKDIELGE
ncbi:hypothetical protein [Streptococcus sobrinus]|uniref:hypothetical protein n=1 Tax=Streptococcus sobrinus TaxID=1310 RepID=UPI0002EA69AE|nr:hypothetical protein [Streptococcus sobrinus]